MCCFTKCFDIISDWTSIWLLHLNIDKCKVLHMGPKSFLLNKTVYFINGVALQNSLVEQDLGILVRYNLNWNQYVNKICSSANYWRKVLYKCFAFKSLTVIKRLYLSIIRPKLEYAVTVWNPTSLTCINQLEKIQRRSTKFGSTSLSC